MRSSGRTRTHGSCCVGYANVSTEPVNQFRFGRQTIATQVFILMPKGFASRQPYVDITAAMDDRPRARVIPLARAADPFGEVEV